MIKRSFLFFAVLLLLSSCTLKNHSNICCIEGTQEFVIDSYKIRQGKLSLFEMQGICLNELDPKALDEYVDVICEDDILNIYVYHPTRKDLMESVKTISKELGFQVRNGKINLPDISSVYVEGLTLNEAKEKLQKEFQKEIEDIEVFISYKDRLSRRVELSGMVSTPHIPVDGKLRLYEALSIAKAHPNANYYKSYIIRDGVPLGVDMHKLVIEGDMSQNIVLRGGDKIFIAEPSDSRIMVTGEVRRPMVINLPNGFMSLREALVRAGGIPYTGNKNCIQVIRGNLVNPKIYVLSWEHVLLLPNDSLLLMPGDTIYVSAKPITEWNRFISQLLPSFNCLNSGVGCYRLFNP